VECMYLRTTNGLSKNFSSEKAEGGIGKLSKKGMKAPCSWTPITGMCHWYFGGTRKDL
jgi:hypothetical protein